MSLREFDLCQATAGRVREGQRVSQRSPLRRRKLRRGTATLARATACAAEIERAACAPRLHLAADRGRQTLLALGALLDALPDAIFAKDRRGRYLLCNRAAARALGRAPDEVIGRYGDEVFAPPLAAWLENKHRLATDHGEALSFDVALRTDDGERIFHTRKGPLCGADGVVVGSYAIAHDVTESRRLEAELEANRRLLEERVARRTHELQLAKQAADAANEAKSAYLATMSHEIRTPLAGVIGLADVLRRSALTPYQSDLVETLRDSSRALMAIIDDLLDFSKIEAGRLDLERSPVDLRALVEGVGDALRVTAASRGVRLHLHVDPALPAQVTCDALRLRQILDNLAGNAIKFSAGLTRAGRVLVRVMAHEGRLRLAVSDNGIGMDDAVRQRLFQPYAQGDRSMSRRYGGTGLGLSIVRRLVDAFGGAIQVHSEPDRGSLFVVDLPLEAAAGDAGSGCGEPSLAGLRIDLCLADDEVARDWAADLEAAGAEVVCAGDRQPVEHDLVRDPADAVVMVIDADLNESTLAALRRRMARHGHRLVCIGRGSARGPRLGERGDVHLDADALHRSALLLALACAAGRRTLPEEPGLRRAEAPPAPPPSAESASAEGRLILVAEDNPINQTVIRRQLALLGFAAEVADDGQQAFERWRSGRYALLLTDLYMPGLDGIELARRIRAEEAPTNRRLPIIVLTASAGGEDGARWREAGIDDFLRKPITPERLAERLAQHLPAGAARIAPAAPLSLPAPEPVFDASVLPKLIGDDALVAARIRREFVASARAASDELRQAVAGADWRAARFVAHRMKSSSRTVGALALGALCERIESAARAGDGVAVTAAQGAFDDAWCAVRGHLQEAHRVPAAEPAVLVIDDDPFQLQVLQQQMQALHVGAVEAAASAADALARLAGRDTSHLLLVTDLDMPGMDGVELMRRLAERAYDGALALVSAADERVLDTCARLAQQHRLNLIGHLRKPVTSQMLGHLVARWKSLRPAAPRPATRPLGVPELRAALSGGEIVLHYQPQVALSRRAVVGVEALARWQHPREGLVYPDRFVALAEEHGLIGELTEVVIGLALDQQVRWRALGLVLPIAVNVSMDNLVQLDLPERLLQRLRALGLPPDSLRLEVTESRLVRDQCAAMDILTRLRLNRIGLAIDDFGTGHSSLAQLRDLPFDELKIDRGFVHGCAERPTQRGIVAASIAMAHELRMKTVAEGVEDLDDWNAMRVAGCDAAQGWFIARPMPGDQVAGWIRDYVRKEALAA